MEFKHNVSEIPKGADLPKYEGQGVKPEVVANPDLQGGISKYAADTNWMSELGANVAAKASNALATKLGGELGKNPQGDIGIPLTDFDKVMQESYNTQAQATLGLQANKLITDSNIEVASASRVTPDLIAKTQGKIALGLQNIFKNAPASIQPQMEYQYGNLMLAQQERLSNRMISEQHEDTKNNIALSTVKLSENTHSLAVAGKDKAAEQAVKDVEKQNNALVAQNLLDPLTAKQRVDSARRSMQAGQYQRKYDEALKNGTSEGFLKSLMKKPENISDADFPSLINSVMSYANQQQSLQSQDQALKISQFQLNAITNPDSAAQDLLALKDSLTNKQYSDEQIWYEKLKIENAKKIGSIADVTSGWSDYNKFNSDFTDKQKLDTLEHNANASAQQKGISQSEAEMQLAATAAGPIKGYTNKLDGKALSGNPQQMDEALAATDYIVASRKPENLIGMSDEAKAMLRMYKGFRDTHDPTTAAQMAKEAVIGKTEQQRKANDIAFDQHYQANKRAGDTKNSFALRIADVPKDRMVNVPLLADFVESKYEGYFKLYNGDAAMATASVKEDIAMTFGDESVNGFKQYTQFPIKKVLDLPDGSDGFVHDDLAGQMSEKFANSKKFYDSGATDSYWEVKPNVTLDEYFQAVHRVDELTNKVGIFDLSHNSPEIKKARKTIEDFNNSPPPKLIQHHRDGSINEYDTVIQSGSTLSRNKNGQVIGYWDVNIKTGNSVSSIAYQDPSMGPMVYIPNRDKIVSGANYIRENYPHYTNEGLIFRYPAFVANNIKEQRERTAQQAEKPSLLGNFARWLGNRASKNIEKDFPGYIEQVKKNLKVHTT